MINRINTARQVKALLALLLPLNVVKLLLKLSIHSTNERQVSEEEVRIVLQAHAEGSSLRGISLISGLAYNTVVSIVQAAALKAQWYTMPHIKMLIRMRLQPMNCGRFALKKQKHCWGEELEAGDYTGSTEFGKG